MGIIILSGGLGNQMFEYSFCMAKRNTGENISVNTFTINREKAHNGYELEKLFGIQANSHLSRIQKFARKMVRFQDKKSHRPIASVMLFLMDIFGIKVVKEKGCSVFNKEYLKVNKKSTLYFGFWQSPKYFENIEDEIRKSFSFKKLTPSIKTSELLKIIQQNESVSLHIRRGDYLKEEYKNVYANICREEYYIKALSVIKENVEKPIFIIFSDDPEWTENNLKLENAIYVDWNSGSQSWEDMYLMSQCKHNIIANSTFSWWGAWLNVNCKKMVIAPSRFLGNCETPDLLPDNWIKIE